MTDKEKAIVMAYTGTCMLIEDKFNIFHEYVEKLMGRPVYTHELGFLADEIKERAEIEKLQKMCDKNDLNLMAQYSAFGMVLDIIDKYRKGGAE